MRLRIFHQIALLLAGMALLSAVASGGWFAWNLRAGFSDYLRSRDAQQLTRFAEVVAQRVDWSQAGQGLPGLSMRDLMDEFLHREGLAPPPDWRPPPAPRADGPGGAAPRPPAPPPPRPPGGPGSLSQRIQVVAPDGRHLGGPRFPPGRTWSAQPVVVDGDTVAYVRMLPSAELQDVDARFLRRQYTGLAVALAATLVLALLAALLAARWLGRPLLEVQAAARRIAGGEFGVQLPATGSREMAELIDDVNRMAAALQQLEGARRRWVAQISHELRTPLSVLQGELEAMQDGVRAASPDMLATLRGEVLQLVRLVNDLHTVSLADLGTLPCALADVRAGALLQRLVQRHAPRLHAAGLTLDVQPGGDPLARWDAGRIEQVLTNLLENALRHTQAPGQVRVHWTDDGSQLRLVVEDSAPGVAPQQVDQLFEPLFRADAARQRRAGQDAGSGLGLSICKAIVVAHGGRIAARASELGGLAITVVLPLQPPEPGP